MLKKYFQIYLFVLMVFVFSQEIFAADWNWNGYLGVNYEDSTAAGKPGSFDTFIFSLISNVNVNDKLHFLGQVDWEHAPYFEIALDNTNGKKEMTKRDSGELTLSKAYFEYRHAEYLQIITGKFFTPIGYQNLSYYSLPSYPYLKIPRESVYNKSSNPQNDALFYQRYAQGVWLKGSYLIEKTDFSYDFYIGNGRSFIEHIDDNDEKGVGGRLQLTLPFLIKINPILSFYTDKYNNNTPDAPQWITQTTYIPGIALGLKDLVLEVEYAASSKKGDLGTEKISAYYVDIYYTYLNKFTPYARYEFIKPKEDLGSVKYSSSETTLGIAYHLRLWEALVKLQVRIRHPDDPAKSDYNIYGIGTAFGF